MSMKIPDLPNGPENDSLNKHIENSQEILDNEAIYMNMFHKKELLNKAEALQLINHLSGALLINECQR